MRLIAAGVVLSMTTAAYGGVVADFVGEFQTPTPSSGWSYLWNANGPLFSGSAFDPMNPPVANVGQWVPLVNDSVGVGGYRPASSANWPEPGPAGYTRVTAGTVYPGQTATQNAEQRYVILAYTVSAAEIQANGNKLFFHTYDFDIPTGLGGNIDVFVFKNTEPQFYYPGGFPTGFDSSPIPTGFGEDFPFGEVVAGDTLYVALGAQNNYQGQPIGVAYTLSLTPEPASMALVLSAVPLALARRRRV